MIGGDDLVFENPGASVAEVLRGAAGLLRAHWREAIFEDAESGQRFEKFWEIPFGKLREILVYRDPGAHESWEKHGADPSNRNQMVHLLASKESVTIVVDDRRDPAIRPLIDELASMVQGGFPRVLRLPSAA
jgi:hypothetical protein